MTWLFSVVTVDWSSADISAICQQAAREVVKITVEHFSFSVMGKVYSSILEKETRNIIEYYYYWFQCGFRNMRGCQEQIF